MTLTHFYREGNEIGVPRTDAQELKTMEPALRKEIKEMAARSAAKDSAFTVQGFRTEEYVTKRAPRKSVIWPSRDHIGSYGP